MVNWTKKQQIISQFEIEEAEKENEKYWKDSLKELNINNLN